MVRCKKLLTSMIGFLFVLTLILCLNACNDPYALKTNWGFIMPEGYTETKNCTVEIGFNAVRVIKCLCTDDRITESYPFIKPNTETADAFSEIKTTLAQCNEREEETNGSPLIGYDVILEIEKNWDSLLCHLIKKSPMDYCLILFDSNNNFLYICESR